MSPEGPSDAETVEVVTWFLEMTDPGQLRAPAQASERLRVTEVTAAAPEFAWFLYAAVGRRWGWVDRLGWSLEAWADHGRRDDVSLHVAWLDDAPAGYVEYQVELPDAVQIVYFGLLPSFMGRGLGGELLTRAVRRAWAWEPDRVWLHTCSLDAPAALENYRARGFRVYDERRERKRVPARLRPAWPEE